jgi:hypothetical protein
VFAAIAISMLIGIAPYWRGLEPRVTALRRGCLANLFRITAGTRRTITD